MNLLERVAEAEEERDAARARTLDLEARLRAVLNSNPETATRALAWMTRAENAERLLLELRGWLDANPSVGELLPTGYVSRLMAQLKSVAILHRDQEALAERPPEDEWWESWKGDQRFFIEPRNNARS